MAVSCHVALVLRKRRREDVSAMIVADEVERTARPRVERGAQRGFARRADGPGGQARVAVSVIGRVKLKFLLGDGAGGGVVIETRGVDHRGVTLERHPRGEAAQEYAGDHRPLFRLRRLLLDQRGQRQDPV